MVPTCHRAMIDSPPNTQRVISPAKAGTQSAPFFRTHVGLNSGLRRTDGGFVFAEALHHPIENSRP